MTTPIYEDMSIDEAEARQTAANTAPNRPGSSFPDPILNITEERKNEICRWLDDWLMDLESQHQPKEHQWTREEENYRAKDSGPRSYPFEGASGTIVPLISMAVDPIFARLDVGLFKNDRIMRFKALKKSMVPKVEALEKWVDYYFRHKINLRAIFQPRLLECTKHGTMVFKTIYDNDTHDILTYDNDWNPIKRSVTTFKGPRVVGISLPDFWFPASYQYLQDAPVVAERIRTTYSKLKLMEAAGKLKNVDKLLGEELLEKSELEAERQKSAGHEETGRIQDKLVVYECWCDYDIDGDGLPERLVATYHRETKTLLQLRYNWYFHQRKPYTVIPYQLTNDSMYGLGLCEMILPFQDNITQWERMASDNAYLANIRMFVARKDSGIEDNPKLYAGRVFRVDDPAKDIVPFAMSDTYNTTLSERQNIIGLTEKRTGVSDYLTGRESPIVGSRATATSTVALIKEGTQRVEEVLENIRAGMNEITLNAFAIWFQYGLDGLDDLVFGDDKMVEDLKDFFDNATIDNVNGSIAVDIAANDAANNRAIQQQMALSIIQVMMQYLEKVLEAGMSGLQAMQTMPQYTQMIGEVMTSARRMFRDLLVAYNIPNPEEYLPDLEVYLNAAMGSATGQPGQIGGGTISPDGLAGISGMGGVMPQATGAMPPQPAQLGNGAGQPPLI